MTSISAKAQTIVSASPLEVFNAFVDAETMSKFWFTRRDQGLREGATVFWFPWHRTDASAIEVNVKELKKPELIRLEWKVAKHFTQVVWRLQQTQNGHTLLIIEESGFKGSEEEIIAKAMDSTGNFNYLVIALKAYFERFQRPYSDTGIELRPSTKNLTASKRKAAFPHESN